MKFVVLASVLCFLISFSSAFDISRLNLPPDGKIWALLVAGSNTYMNYRHQADICHAYQIMHKHGIPDEQIIVMMYDDIANDPENPTKGIVINHPNGEDVYKGTLKDYIGESVTPENFLKILQGEEEAMKGIGSGKVVKSGPSDHIFVFFADHGAPGLIAFPSDELYADNLTSVLKKMHEDNKFAKMVLYVEACESGSMFDGLLPNNINIFATTAANSEESSYACYFDDKRGTYLGDVYSVNWMEDSDKENLNQETLNKQFQIVKKETNTSHVQEFGDLSIADLKVSEFQGTSSSDSARKLSPVPWDAVPSPDVPLMILKHKIEKANSFEEHAVIKSELEKILRNREFLEKTVKDIVAKATFSDNQSQQILNKRFQLKDFTCYKEVSQYFSSNCFTLSKNAYALRQLYILVNMCETGISIESQKKAMDAVCTLPPMYNIV